MSFFLRFFEILALLAGLSSALFAVALFASMTTEIPLWLSFLGGLEQLLVQVFPLATELAVFVRAMILSVLSSALLGTAAFLRAYHMYLRQRQKGAKAKAVSTSAKAIY